MNLRRLLKVAALDIRHNAQRPLFWILILILALTAWGLSTGHMRISSGDSQVGGTKAWLTSEFAIAQMLTFVVFLFYAFFIAVAAGMTVIHEDDLKVGRIIHATPLKPSEYVYGKVLAVLVSFVGVLILHLLLTMLFYQVVPNAATDEIRGPFVLMNYLRPAVMFALPTIFFLIGTAFAAGVWTRNSILVFVLPVAMLLVCAFFLWEWSPSWLDPAINRALMAIDPAGFRWLNETWLKVDRGVNFYNTGSVGVDGTFLVNRALLVLGGLGAMVLAQFKFARQVRGVSGARASRRARETAEPAGEVVSPETVTGSLSGLAVRGRAPGFWRGAWLVARAEVKELKSQAGLYLFVPLILLQTIGSMMFEVGPFETPLLATPGGLAVRTMGMLTTLIALLLLFYTVESLERERSSGLSPIYLSTPVPTGGLLFGKALANTLIAAVILLAAFLGCVVVLLIQGKVPIDIRPFVMAWGLLLLPTFLVWTTFVMALHSLVRNKYTTYALALAAMIWTGYKQGVGEMNWVGNWALWGAPLWTDLGPFELNRTGLILNRLFVLGLSGLFVAMTVRFYSRADRDVSRTGARLRPSSLLRGAAELAPMALVPAVVGVVLALQVHGGFQGKVAEKAQKDYWRRNVATWRDAKYPSVTDVNLKLAIEPAKRWLRSEGVYTLVNHGDDPIRQVPLTRGLHWKDVAWTMNGDSLKPDDRVGLVVFTPPAPLAKGDTLRLGWSFEGHVPDGITKNGGGTEEFILPAGVVLTSFRPTMAPLVGYDETIGIDKDNRYDSREFPEDFYKGYTKPAFGTGHHMTTHVEISGPADYIYNSVGTKVSDAVEGDHRTTVWQSDYPVNFFNVVAGRWKERRGEGTIVYYYGPHAYNIDEISEGLEAARRYYSEWFMPFPWKELKISEFPALAGYAQGFPTDIAFSEAIGFLTKNDERADLSFMVTAHESAHQWWGNILLPGEGPGGNILSEGMAHFSTILLTQQAKGERQRIEFCKRIEERYGDRRQVDSERPLVKIDGTKPGDTSVTYDKGGWVFWMLLQHMGRERALAGVQDFIRRYSTGEDFAVLQDFVAVMREHAADVDAYDAFVKQWFFDVVVPEYQLSHAERALIPDPSVASASAAGTAHAETWEAKFEVANTGTGTMPVEVAVVRGERFPKDSNAKGAKAKAASSADASDGDHAYREARQRVELAAGEHRTMTFRCDFKPERALVDPDALVLQLNRERATVKF